MTDEEFDSEGVTQIVIERIAGRPAAPANADQMRADAVIAAILDAK